MAPWQKNVAIKLTLRSLAVMMPSLSVSMMPKASLNSWICFWEKYWKMLISFLAFLRVKEKYVTFGMRYCGGLSNV